MDKTYKTGFTIVELLISLVILALLMTAIGYAFDASVDSFNSNNNTYTSLNSARQLLNRITFELRNAQAVATDIATDQCSLITNDGRDITYKYVSSEKELWLITNDITSDDDYLLCDGLLGMEFEKQIESKNGIDYVKYVKISLKTEKQSSIQNLSSAVAIRKNL